MNPSKISTNKGFQIFGTLLALIMTVPQIGNAGRLKSLSSLVKKVAPEIKVEIRNNQFDEVSILDITGKQLYNSKIIKSNSLINISHLSRGFYFVKFNSGNTYKIIKM